MEYVGVYSIKASFHADMQKTNLGCVLFHLRASPLVPFDLTAKEVVDTVEVGGRSFDANRPQLGAILFPGKGKPAGWDKRPMNAAGGFLQNNSRIGALTESYG